MMKTSLFPETCPLAEYILHLEDFCRPGVTSGSFVFLLLLMVEASRKFRFQKVYSVEQMVNEGRFSNADYIVKSWTLIALASIGIIFSFFNSIYSYIFQDNLIRVMLSTIYQVNFPSLF